VLEHGESIPDGLRREVREETGLAVEPDALTGVYKNLAQGIVALVFRCHATGGLLASTAEVDDLRWLHRDGSPR
jgi:8-oxo-dGTP diphosphatase